MSTQFTPPTTQDTAPTMNVAAPVSPHVGRVPLAASQIPQPLSASPAPKKSGSFSKLLLFLILLVVLAGGVGVAVYLNSQTQDIRQDASQVEIAPENYPETPFTFQTTQPRELAFVRNVEPGDPGPSRVFGDFTFSSGPSCGPAQSCQTTVNFQLANNGVFSNTTCRTGGGSLVYYTFLTDVNSGSYPGDLNTSNCNRPVTNCRPESPNPDPNCVRNIINPISGPSGCGDRCTQLQASVPFSITNTEYGCGCVQLDVNISEIELECDISSNPAEPDWQTYRFTRDTSEDEGPWAYAYNTAQCDQPVTPPASTPTPTPQPTNTPPPGLTATPTPTSPPGSTPTPTPAPVGPMCVSISMSPTAPKLGDTATFTCGRVTGITEYQFRYFEPGSSSAISLSAANQNVSSPLTITKSGNYRAQCRVCPSNADRNNSCANPNWGWDPVPAP